MAAERSVEAKATAEENVHVAACDVAILRYHCPEFDALPDAAKATVLEEITREHDVGQRDSRSNTTCIGLDEYRAANLSEGQSADMKLAELAIGTGTTTPAHSNRSLNNEAVRTDTTSFDDQGSSLVVRTFLDTSEGNNAGSDLAEIGLLLDDGSLVNHSLVTSVSKTSSRAITFEVTLSFGAA